MKNSTCDAVIGGNSHDTCNKIAYREVSLRQNYWFGDKYLKIDLCQEHFEKVLKSLGFENECRAQNAYGNQWRKID